MSLSSFILTPYLLNMDPFSDSGDEGTDGFRIGKHFSDDGFKGFWRQCYFSSQWTSGTKYWYTIYLVRHPTVRRKHLLRNDIHRHHFREVAPFEILNQQWVSH